MLAYPLNRGADMDVGGAADLQTDVMRFMAILSLCLVAIFALVQSLPVAAPAKPVPQAAAIPVAKPKENPIPEVAVITPPTPALQRPQQVKPAEVAEVPKTVALTQPKWVPKYKPVPAPTEEIPVNEVESQPPAEVKEGFTLRFESDTALTRLVATNLVGVYAIDGERAKRMTVSESRISFWDASVPNSFHEMEISTVPTPVINALGQSGVESKGMSWGVTLPGKLKSQLDGLTQENRGGALVIESDGNIRLETK